MSFWISLGLSQLLRHINLKPCLTWQTHAHYETPGSSVLSYTFLMIVDCRTAWFPHEIFLCLEKSEREQKKEKLPNALIAVLFSSFFSFHCSVCVYVCMLACVRTCVCVWGGACECGGQSLRWTPFFIALPPGSLRWCLSIKPRDCRHG